MTKFFTLIFLICWVTQAQAEVWHTNSKISRLYPTSGGYVFLLEVPMQSVSTCDGGRRFEIHSSNPNYDALVSSLLMAFAMQKPIRINITNENNKTCSPVVNRFMVFQ